MKSNASKDLATSLRQLRLYHHYPQRYVALRLNISQVAYSKLERGLTALTDHRLLEIAALYELHPDELTRLSADDLILRIIERKAR